MESKKYLYAAVGAPVSVAKAAQTRVDDLRTRLSKNVESATSDLQRQIDAWVDEGESLIGKIGDSPAMDEITERVDLDQVQEQVSKLRDQLEDLLATWRTNFRPGAKVEIEVEVTEPAPKKAAASKTSTKKTATTAKTTSSGTAAKKSPASKSTAKKAPASKSSTKSAPASSTKKSTAKAS